MRIAPYCTSIKKGSIAMLYGMDDDEEEFDDDFKVTTELVEQRHLNKKKVAGLIIIVIAIITIIISTISIVKTMSKPTEVNSYSFEDKISINDYDESKDNQRIEDEERRESSDNREENHDEDNNNNENHDENNEQSSEESEEDDTTYRENAGNSYYPDKKDNEEVVTNENVEVKSGVYSGMHMQIPEHDIEKIKMSFVPQFIENSQQAVKDIYYSEERQVYLTFDDGPSPDITPRILDILKDEGVPATFFVLGKYVEKHPDLLKREYNEGHYIANHGYSHSYSTIYENKDTVYDEFVHTENCIKNALSNQNYNTYLFRFPGGSSGGRYESVKSEARELFRTYGVAFTNWNCLSGDAENSKTAEQCINRFRETANDPSLIVLMHDANDKEQTVEALPTIIHILKDEGYTFKNFYEIFK